MLFKLLGFFTLLFLFPLSAEESAEITWYGHAAFKIKTAQGQVILIDPWINNPSNPNGQQDLENLDKVDFILITHGHDDHIGNAVEIAERTKAHLVATYDLGNALVKYQNYPAEHANEERFGNFGGKIPLDNGNIIVHFIPAVHSSSVVSKIDGNIMYGGNPGGFLIEMKNGPTVYHTGDTDLFSDMKLIPKIKYVDVMLVCIGGVYTMDPHTAAQAVKWVRPKIAVPMHFGTFQALTGTPKQFNEEMLRLGAPAKMRLLKLGAPLLFKQNGSVK